MDFYTGAFPANRPNALSSVMDIRMKDGSRDRLHTKLSLGASDASLTLDGPVNSRSTFIFSARQSYLQMLFKWLELAFLPTYHDFQLKYDYRISERRNLSIIGLGSIDKTRLNTDLGANASEYSRFVLNMLPVYDQWHYTVGAVYKVLGEKHTDRWVLSRNMLDNGSYKHVGNQEQMPKIFDYQSQESENKLRFERIFWGLPFNSMSELACSMRTISTAPRVAASSQGCPPSTTMRATLTSCPTPLSGKPPKSGGISS